MGRDKTVLRVAGERLVDRAVRTARACFREVLVVGGDATRSPIPDLSVPQIGDLRPGNGALGGIHTGLLAMDAEVAVVLACDMPLLDPAFLALLAGYLGDDEVLVPRGPSGLQPLCGAYRRSCVPAIERCLDRGERRVFAFYPDVRTREVDLAALEGWGDREDIFSNVNTPADLIRVEEQLAQLARTGGR